MERQQPLNLGAAGPPLFASALVGGRAFEPCRDAISTLYSFLDGELTLERRQMIQQHLDECAPCMEAFGFEADLKALIALKCRDEAPDSLRRRVAEALQAEDMPS
jgi:mycothiol system anti-sigma-R factor